MNTYKEYTIKTIDENGTNVEIKYCAKFIDNKWQWWFIGLKNTTLNLFDSLSSLTIPHKVITDDGESIEIKSIQTDVFKLYETRNFKMNVTHIKSHPQKSFLGYGILGNEKHPISKLIIEPGIVEVSRAAFHSLCVDTVIWPETCPDIKIKTFIGCQKLKNVIGIENVNNIDSMAFASTGLEKFKWPTNVDTVPQECFKGSKLLKEVEFAGPIKMINRGAFKNTAVEKIDLSHTLSPLVKIAYDNDVPVIGSVYSILESI